MVYTNKIQYKRIVIFWLCGTATHSFGLSSQNSESIYSISKNSENTHLSEIRTNFVLLPDSGGRFRRDVNVTSGPEETTSDLHLDNEKVNDDHNTDDDNKIYSSDENGSSRGHLSVEEHLENVDITEDKINQMTKSHENEFKFENDTYKYYSSTFQEDGTTYFHDLDTKNQTGAHAGKVKEHSMLSQSYRRAATINLSFKFPFYGHQVENITIATGGFLYTGDYVHSWLAATQYIAPLMANFDTSNNHNAKIRYLDDGVKLVVEWKDVYLQERETEGPFTFQVTLHANGNIVFAYHTIPLEIVSIQDEDHPVKVGLSDAYIIDRTVYFARRKTIYEYHRLNMKNKEIKNKTAILFQALETCNLNKNCQTCLGSTQTEDMTGKGQLDCRWCAELGRCSDGTDRNRQDWLKNKCDSHNISQETMCPAPGQTFLNYHGKTQHTIHSDQQLDTYTDKLHAGPAMSPGGIVMSVFVCMLVITLFGWVGYAYFNPNTSSGRFLIKYRPGAWRWRQSGARYTAASIHM
jgi:hypothetical protein